MGKKIKWYGTLYTLVHICCKWFVISEKMNGVGGDPSDLYSWKEVTSPFLEACTDLTLGELLHDQGRSMRFVGGGGANLAREAHKKISTLAPGGIFSH